MTNTKAAKQINWDKPIRTTCGKPARLLCKDYKFIFRAQSYLIAVTYPDGFETAINVDVNGNYLSKPLVENIPEITSTWENLYGSCSGGQLQSRKSADTYQLPNRVAVLRRDFQDGVFIKAELEPMQIKDLNVESI